MRQSTSMPFLLLALRLLFTSIHPLHAIPNDSILRLAFIKGPSGLAATWLIDSPPKLEGSRIEITLSAGADLVVAKIISGEVDGGTLPLNTAAKLYNSGVPIVMVAVTGEGMVRFLSRDPSIKSLSDLAGKEIHVAGQKATPDYLFRFLAERSGMDADRDFKLSYRLSYAEAAAALASGKITHAILPEPFATQARMLDSSILSPIDIGRLWSQATGMESYPMTVFVVSKTLAQGSPQELERIAKAFGDSILRVSRSPEESALKAESLDLGIKAAVAAKAIPFSSYTFKYAIESKTSVERMLEVFLAFDPASIGGRLPDPQFYGKIQGEVR